MKILEHAAKLFFVLVGQMGIWTLIFASYHALVFVFADFNKNPIFTATALSIVLYAALSTWFWHMHEKDEKIFYELVKKGKK